MRWLIAISILLFPAIAFAETANINEGWSYLEEGYSDPGTAAGAQGWSPVDLPHTWNAFDTTDREMGYRRDASWYRKTIDIPADGEVFLLRFEAAQMKADVYVDGRRAGSHVGGYIGFDIDITDLVTPGGQAEIMVRVDNGVDRNLIPSQKADFFQFGGLTRDVYLVSLPSTHVADVLIRTPIVTADEAAVQVELDIHEPTRGAKAVVSILSPEGRTIAETQIDADRQRVNVTQDIPAPMLWSPDAPNLYSAEIALMDRRGETVHTAQERFGLRWFRFEPHGAFYLNGERLLLRGTHRHEEHAGLGSAMSNALHRRDMEMIKAMGANFVRLGHYPNDPEIYRAADELGLIVWDELYWNRGGAGGEAWRENTQRLFREMIVQNFNHPSILFWSVGNEMYWLPDFDGGGGEERVRGDMQALHDIAKALDPTRLTAVRKVQYADDIVDVYSPSIWAGWYGGGYGQYADAIREAQAEYPQLLHMEYGGSSHVGRHLARTHGRFGTVDEGGQASVEEMVNQSGVTSVANGGRWDETYIVDLFDWHLGFSETADGFPGNAQWAFKDFGTPLRPENPIPFVNQKGLVDRAGRPKDAYYVFASYWSDEPVCYIESPTWDTRYGEPGARHEISVFCNTQEAELFINGSSLGRKTRDISSFPAAGLTWDVAFSEGENTLVVHGLDDGAVTAAHETGVTYIHGESGRLDEITLAATPLGDGVFEVTARALDSEGRLCITCQTRVYFAIDGGRFLDNLGTPDGSSEIELANGKAKIRFVHDGDEPAVVSILSQQHKGTYLTVPAR